MDSLTAELMELTSSVSSHSDALVGLVLGAVALMGLPCMWADRDEMIEEMRKIVAEASENSKPTSVYSAEVEEEGEGDAASWQLSSHHVANVLVFLMTALTLAKGVRTVES